MSFQESLQNEMADGYRYMLNGQTLPPFNTVVKIGQYEAFERAFNNYHNRLESERSDFNSCLKQIIRRRDDRVRAENDADRRRRETAEQRHFIFVEWIKTISFNIPTIILFIIALILVGNPALLLTNMHFGWIIGIYVVAFIASLITAGVVVGKSKRGDEYIFIKQRCAIMISGAMIYGVLMSLGLGLAYKHTYSLKSAEDFKLIANLPSAELCNFVIEDDIDFEGKSYGIGCLNYFRGTIDGQGHTLSNINYTYSNEKNNFGLVNRNYGTIKNLAIKDSVFHLGSNDSGAVIAVPYRYSNAPENCFVINSIVVSSGKEMPATAN